jgi:hypothetical protein
VREGERMMGRLGLVIATGLFVAAALVLVSPDAAEAHYRTVTPPGTGDTLEGWVGTGEGAFVGIFETSAATEHVDPDHLFGVFFSSHALGLNAACAGTESNDVADIRGPGGPGCPHGE